MAADRTVHVVPPSLSAKVVGYADSFFIYITVTENIVGNNIVVSKRVDNLRNISPEPAMALAFFASRFLGCLTTHVR